MRKILLLAVCSLFLFTGCEGKKEEAWKKDFQVSEFYLEENENELIGSIKNISSINCNSVFITITYKSGSLEDEYYCSVHNLNSGETADVYCLVTEDAAKRMKNSILSVTNVRCSNYNT